MRRGPRATASGLGPTMIRIGFVGKVCAVTAAADSSSAPAHSASKAVERERKLVMAFPIVMLAWKVTQRKIDGKRFAEMGMREGQ